MCNDPISFGLALIQEASNKALSLAFAPVPDNLKNEGGGFTWTILIIIIAVAVIFLVFRVLSRWTGKSDN